MHFHKWKSLYIVHQPVAIIYGGKTWIWYPLIRVIALYWWYCDSSLLRGQCSGKVISLTGIRRNIHIEVLEESSSKSCRVINCLQIFRSYNLNKWNETVDANDSPLGKLTTSHGFKLCLSFWESFTWPKGNIYQWIR